MSDTQTTNVTFTVENMDQVIGYLTDEYIAPLFTLQTFGDEATARAAKATFDRLVKLVNAYKTEYDQQAKTARFEVPTFRKLRETTPDKPKPIPSF
jgi:hypothetical protein